jgi:3-isopropylmalate/(R)-2-methylmalate dehydratase small subunit
MQPFTTFEAVAAPFDQPNIDTDQIIPARYLGKPREGQVEGLFRDLRYDDDGREQPAFILNRPGFRAARIIVAERNFGCGSSRENAVTALLDNGFRAFIAPSFGDIFYNNCFQNGCLPVRLADERVAALRAALHANPGVTLAVDLEARTVRGPDGHLDQFEIDSFRRDCLLRGMDMLDLTLSHEAEIAAFEARQKSEMAWL